MNRFELILRGNASSKDESGGRRSCQHSQRYNYLDRFSPLDSDASTTASAKTTKAVSPEPTKSRGVESGRGSGRY